MASLQELTDQKREKYKNTLGNDPEFLRVVEAAITLQNEELDVLKIWSQAILTIAREKGIDI